LGGGTGSGVVLVESGTSKILGIEPITRKATKGRIRGTPAENFHM